MRDDRKDPRGTGDEGRQGKRGVWENRGLELRGLDRDEDLQVDRVVAIRILDRDAVVRDRRGRVRREVRVHRCRMMVVVIRIDVRVQEWRTEGAPLDGERQTECEHAAYHAAILYQNREAVV